MDTFDKRLCDILTAVWEHHTPAQCDVAREEIMSMVRQAILREGHSAVIDEALVTYMTSDRSDEQRFARVEHGDRRVEYAPDPRIEIFCRVYEVERRNNASPDLAAERAMVAAAAFKPMMLVRS